jgi:hypothetical protein
MIAVTGNWAGDNSTASDSNSNPANMGNNSFQVSSFRHLSDTCDNASSPGNSGNEANPPQASAAGDSTVGTAMGDTSSSESPDATMAQNTTPANPSGSDMSNQNSTPSDQGMSSDQGTSSDSNMPAESNSSGENTGNESSKLPQSASPLPLLGLLGFGSMAAGWVMRKLK